MTIDDSETGELFDVMTKDGRRIATTEWPWDARLFLDSLPEGERVERRSDSAVIYNKVRGALPKANWLKTSAGKSTGGTLPLFWGSS
jgi:hypothetical protein